MRRAILIRWTARKAIGVFVGRDGLHRNYVAPMLADGERSTNRDEWHVFVSDRELNAYLDEAYAATNGVLY